jgi:hypothetical protein
MVPVVPVVWVAVQAASSATRSRPATLVRTARLPRMIDLLRMLIHSDPVNPDLRG